jgi:hypothetical protein
MLVYCGRTPYAPYSSQRLGCSRSPPFGVDGPHVQIMNMPGVSRYYRAVSMIRIEALPTWRNVQRPTWRFCPVGLHRSYPEKAFAEMRTQETFDESLASFEVYR